MRSTSANYTAANTGKKKPVAIVELYDKTALVSGAEYSSQIFSNIATTEHKKYVRNLSIQTDRIDFLTNNLPGAISTACEIVDKSQDVTGKLSGSAVIELLPKIGFQSLDDTDFFSLPQQRITGTNFVKDNKEVLGYQFVARDARDLFAGNIFNNLKSSFLNGSLTSSATTITVDDGTLFIDPSNLSSHNSEELGSWFFPAVKIDSEWCSYTAISTNDLTTVTRGYNSTTAAAHDDNAKIKQVLSIAGTLTWADLLLFILMTTIDGDGHNYYDLTRIDSNFSGMGLGLTASDIDITTIERLGYKIDPWQSFKYYVIEEPKNAYDWINKNLLIPNGIILYTNSSGLLSAQALDFIHLSESFSSVVDFDNSDDTIVDSNLSVEDDKLINFIEFQNTNPLYGSGTKVRFELDSSVTAYNRNRVPTVFNIPLIIDMTTFISDEYLSWVAHRWLYFFANPPGMITVQTNFENWLPEPGDYATFTHARWPDLVNDGLGVSSLKSIIVSQKCAFDFIESSYKVIYDLFSWELYDKITAFYTKTATVTEGSITDKTATESATFTLTDPPEAADAYHDFASTITPDVWMATVRITPPGSGSTEHGINLRIDATENVAGTYTLRSGRAKTIVRYNSGDSTAFTVPMIWAANADRDTDRIYLQFLSTSATGGEVATVELIQLDYFTLDESITVS